METHRESAFNYASLLSDSAMKEEAWSIIQPACHQDGGAPNLQQRSWARCDEDYSCRHKTSCQNQLPQLQGGHESHKTFSKSTPQNPRNQSRGGTCPTKRPLRAPLQCVPVKSKKSKFNCKFQNQNHKMFTRTNLRINNKYNPAAPVVDRGEEAAPAVTPVLYLRHGLIRGRGDNRISSSSLHLSTYTQQQPRHTRLVTLVITRALL